MSRVLAVTSLFAAGAPLPRRADAQIAVIVSRSSPLQSVTSDELKRMFLGSTKAFADLTPVMLVEYPPLRQAFYRSALALSDLQFKRHWIKLVFSGEVVTPPSQIADEPEVRRFVASHPGAIGFLPLSAVDGTVRALTVDGHAPSDPAYKIR